MIDNKEHKITIAHYHSDDLMCLLICENPQMLFVLNRFDISLGFGDKTIAEVCQESHVELGTFLAVVNILLCGDKSEHINYSEIDPIALVQYLKKSHFHYLEYRLPNIRRTLISLLGNTSGNMTGLIVKYFEEYLEEVRKHLKYEEEVVFPYVSALVNGEKDPNYDIDTFCKKHDNIDLKLSELKDIVIKYFQTPSTNEIIEVLSNIFVCSDDLVSHNIIEDHLFVPLIKYLENGINKK